MSFEMEKLKGKRPEPKGVANPSKNKLPSPIKPVKK